MDPPEFTHAIFLLVCFLSSRIVRRSMLAPGSPTWVFRFIFDIEPGSVLSFLLSSFVAFFSAFLTFDSFFDELITFKVFNSIVSIHFQICVQRFFKFAFLKSVW